MKQQQVRTEEEDDEDGRTLFILGTSEDGGYYIAPHLADDPASTVGL